MTQTVITTEQVVHPDGRVELEDQSAVTGSPYANAELAPTRITERTWTTYNYTALWMGMAHNIPSYLLASGLVALGMDWLQAFLTITLGNLMIPFLQPLYDYSWAVGLVAGFLVYLGLAMASPARSGADLQLSTSAR